MATPTWVWPDWRNAETGTRFRHVRSGREGTFIKPSRNRNNGAIVRWDGQREFSNVVAPARDLVPLPSDS